MPSNKAELAARLAATKPGDAVRGLFFKVLLELAEQVGGAEAHAKVLVGPLAGNLSNLATYPAVDYITLLYNMVDALEDKLGSEDAVFRACGAACVRRFASGPGQVFFGILGMGDPHKLLSQAKIAFKTALTFGSREYQKTGPKSCILLYRGDPQPPSYNASILEGAFTALGVRGKVTARPLSIDATDFDITWE